MFDIPRLVCLDLETYKFCAGHIAPPAVCGAAAYVGDDSRIRSTLLPSRSDVLSFSRLLLEGHEVSWSSGEGDGIVRLIRIPDRPILVGMNLAYDLSVLAAEDESLLPLIFRAFQEKRVYDIAIAMQLDAIHGGHLGVDPRTRKELRDPITKKLSRYNLNVCVDLVLGRTDAKANDVFRTSYALLEGFPASRWPDVARQYPCDDAENTLEVAVRQLLGWSRCSEEFRQRLREKLEEESIDGLKRKIEHIRNKTVERGASPEEAKTAAKIADGLEKKLRLLEAAVTDEEDEDPDIDDFEGPARNLDDLPAQAETAFCLTLGGAWGLRSDPERVALLSADVDEKHRQLVERYQKLGFVRKPCKENCGRCEACEKAGKEDSVAVKHAVAIAYGATGVCPRCSGRGKVRPEKEEPCRGPKQKGRYRGCSRGGEVGRCSVCGFITSGCRCALALGESDTIRRVDYAPCTACNGSGAIVVVCEETTCKAQDGGCDGTGFDLSTAPMLARTDKGGIKTDRDALMESGNEDLSTYAANEFEKVRTTFVPWLKKGIINPSANVLVASGRCSYEGGPIHQITRESGYWKSVFGSADIYIPSVRECFRARGVWCGSPVEYVYSSTDFSAGELCSLSQLMWWTVRGRNMLDAINTSGDPGILHSEVAAEVLGIPLPDFLKRLKAKDKQAVDFRQAAKPISFGAPALMGAIAIVLTSRKKSAGTTVLPDGRKIPGIRFCVTIGGETTCGVNKFIAQRRNKPPVVVCSACVDVVKDILLPAYFRRFPEVRDYFDWARDMVDDTGTIPSLVWDAEKQEVVATRRRGGTAASAACNNGFQAMLADIGKLAWRRMVREAYLGVQEDGSPSPLAGSKFIAFMHDEPVAELIKSCAHVAGPRIAYLMTDSGKRLAPDVTWKAETAIAYYLAKGMEPVYVDGMLVPWEPKRVSVKPTH